MRFEVFQQQLPQASRAASASAFGVPLKPILEHIDHVNANSAEEAIAKAKNFPVFKYARKDTLAAFPIVEVYNP